MNLHWLECWVSGCNSSAPEWGSKTIGHRYPRASEVLPSWMLAFSQFFVCFRNAWLFIGYGPFSNMHWTILGWQKCIARQKKRISHSSSASAWFFVRLFFIFIYPLARGSGCEKIRPRLQRKATDPRPAGGWATQWPTMGTNGNPFKWMCAKRVAEKENDNNDRTYQNNWNWIVIMNTDWKMCLQLGRARARSRMTKRLASHACIQETNSPDNEEQYWNGYTFAYVPPMERRKTTQPDPMTTRKLHVSSEKIT